MTVVSKRQTRIGMVVIEQVEMPNGGVLLMPWVPSWGRNLFKQLQAQSGFPADNYN